MRQISNLASLLSACLWLSCSVYAQSTDIGAPSPVRTNEVSGTIAARDIGDARLTDHFYAFTGTPGDLLITVDSHNMNGDVDVFTAAGLRPLLKFPIYAGGSGPITKSVYLRQRQDLILRVEARSPNDDEADYRIHFGGAFAPIEGGSLLAENENNSAQPATPETRTAKKGRRVSSVGARIEEPPEPEVAAAPTPEPTPETAEPINTEPTRTTTRTPRNRRPTRGSKRSETTAVKEPAATETEAGATAATAAPAEPSTSETRPTPRRRGSRRGTTARKEPAPAPEPEPNTGPRLVIETSDGTLIDRYMSTVRRVTVENGVVVVTGKDGKIDRVLLANVVRMSISP